MTDLSIMENLKGSVKAMTVLFYALFAGVIIFLLIILGLLQLQIKFLEGDDIDKIFLIVALVIAVICLVSAVSVYNKRVSEIANSTLSLTEKLNSYRATLILYLALSEGPAMFSIICLLLTGNYWCMAVTAGMLIAMLFKKPSRQKLIDELQLDWQDQGQL